MNPTRNNVAHLPWADALVSAGCSALIVWLGSWGYAALQTHSVAQQRLVQAAQLADGLAQSAGAGDAQESAKTLQVEASALIAHAFVTDKGGVDEYGIARGVGLLVGGDELDADLKQQLLNHDKSVIAAAEQAAQQGVALPWQRLTTTMPDGGRLIAVPYRSAVDAPAAGVAGFVLRPTPATSQTPAWLWLCPFVVALFVFGFGRGRQPGLGLGMAPQLFTVAMLFVGMAPQSMPSTSLAQQAQTLVFPHAGPALNAALATADMWLLGALILLATLLGAGRQFLASIVRALRDDSTPYAYVGPAVVATGVLIFVPFFVGVGLSFTTADGTFVGIDNYVEVIRSFSDPNSATHFMRTFIHTVIWTVMNVSAHVTIGLALALLLNRPNLRGRKMYRLLLIIPWAVPNYITALTWKWMFNTQYGPINVIMAGLGLEPVDWLGQSALTNFTANLITNIWLGFPFMMVISLGALQSIPAELYEAAAIDGAKAWQRFRHITLPLLKPALFPAVILGTIWTFNAFNVIYLVSGGGPDHQTEILITEAYYLFTVLRRIGLAAAYSVLIFVLLLAYTLITNKLTSATEAVDR